MESTDTYNAITEATNDWESGDAALPAANYDYSRASHEHSLDAGPEDEANSDLGNLGRDVQEAEPVGADSR